MESTRDEKSKNYSSSHLAGSKMERMKSESQFSFAWKAQHQFSAHWKVLEYLFWYKVQTISMQIRLLPFINEIKSYFNHYFLKFLFWKPQKIPYCKYSKLTKTIGVMIIEMRIKVNFLRQFSSRLKTVRTSTLSLQSLGCIGPSPCSLSWLPGT